MYALTRVKPSGNPLLTLLPHDKMPIKRLCKTNGPPESVSRRTNKRNLFYYIIDENEIKSKTAYWYRVHR